MEHNNIGMNKKNLNLYFNESFFLLSNNFFKNTIFVGNFIQRSKT
jgi:hypothetical protein